MHGIAERFLLYHPGSKLYHCGGFCDKEQRSAYMYPSLQVARQCMARAATDCVGCADWRIQRVLVEWNDLGELTRVEVIDEI